MVVISSVVVAKATGDSDVCEEYSILLEGPIMTEDSVIVGISPAFKIGEAEASVEM